MMKFTNKWDVVKLCLIALPLLHTIKECWIFFDNTKGNFVHLFWDGNGDAYGVTAASFFRSFISRIQDNVKDLIIVLFVYRHYREIATFFYWEYAYYCVNLVLFWYNFCTWPLPFYIMITGFWFLAYKLWPPKNKLHSV